MHDILLNAVRLAVSDDARRGAAAIVNLIRQSPEWQRNLCTLSSKVESDRGEHAALLSALAEEKLRRLRFRREAVAAFRTVYAELVANAFEHGCESGQSIEISIETTPEYVSTTILNPKRNRFNPLEVLEVCREKLKTQPGRERGRGLVLVAELADVFLPAEERGAKAVLLRQRVLIEEKRVQDVTVLRLNGGMFNPSLSRRLSAALSRLLIDSHVVLDLSEYSVHIATVVYTVALRLQSAQSESRYRFVLLLAKSTRRTISLFSHHESVVSSWRGALVSLDRMGIYEQLVRTIGMRGPKTFDAIDAASARGVKWDVTPEAE